LTVAKTVEFPVLRVETLANPDNVRFTPPTFDVKTVLVPPNVLFPVYDPFLERVLDKALEYAVLSPESA
jgi:hypothetical protein